MALNFSPNDEIIIFSTNRAQREHKKGQENKILQKSFTLSEFLERAILAKNAGNFLKKADNATCLYYLKKAINATKKANEVLHIPDEFFAFLKSSEYIFGFFRELKSANVGFDKLFLKDIYANYEEHLSILQALQNEYEKLLANDGYYDTISLSYEINTAFITEFKKFKIFLDGVPSKYELSVIKELCKNCEIKLCFKSTKFNKKLLSLLKDFFELSLEVGKDYEIELNSKKILKAEKLEFCPKNVNLQALSLRSFECAFVFDEISKMLRAGLKPEDIVVILPDESFSDILMNADKNHMLNYAMGKSMKKTMFYVVLEALYFKITENSKWADELLKNIDEDILNFLEMNFDKSADFAAIQSIFNTLLKLDNNYELENKVNDELFALKNLAKKIEQTMSVRQLINLMLENLKNMSISLSDGGSVTAMGILESRSLNPKGVIIVDFSDDLVPKRLDKEMFLSSQIRASAGLISHNDRENLQRNYYYNLISNASFLSICYHEDDEKNTLSRFFNELGLKSETTKKEASYYEQGVLKTDFVKAKNLVLNYSAKDFFSSPVSFSKVSAFLECKEIFYYKYIAKIKEPKDEFAPRDFADFGNIIHKVFENYFKKFTNTCDEVSLRAYFLAAIKDEFFEKNLDKLEFMITLQNIPKIAKAFSEHFAAGWRVLECESEKLAKIYGFEIKGKIDRIDINENGELMVIDYKTGKIPDDDLQLEFYKALSGAKYAKFFDLKENFNFVMPKNECKNLQDVFALICQSLSGDSFDFSCSCDKKHAYSAYKELLEE